MAKQKYRPTRPGGFSGAKAYIWHVEVLKKAVTPWGGLFATPSSIHQRLKYAGPILING
jgi:hypothetical protein